MSVVKIPMKEDACSTFLSCLPLKEAVLPSSGSPPNSLVGSVRQRESEELCDPLGSSPDPPPCRAKLHVMLTGGANLGLCFFYHRWFLHCWPMWFQRTGLRWICQGERRLMGEPGWQHLSPAFTPHDSNSCVNLRYGLAFFRSRIHSFVKPP